MISGLFSRVAQFDLGFMLVRATLMLPILAAARTLSRTDLGEYSQMYHQLLIVSSVVLFGVHDKITVEREVDVPAESARIFLRLIILSPVVLLYGDVWLSVATLLFLHFSRSIPMMLLAAARAQGQSGEYVVVCVTTTVSSIVLCGGYALGWSPVASTLAATAVMAPTELRAALSRRRTWQGPRSLRGAFGGWDYCLNFLFTSLFTQGVLFMTSFVASADEYATISRVMYLVQAGLLLQSVAYRMVLSLMVDGTVRLKQVVIAHGALGVLWFAAMAAAGGRIETVLFGSRDLDGVAYLLIGLLVMFQTLNLALAPYLLAGRQVRRTLLVPASAGIVALAYVAAWNTVQWPYMIYAMIASVTATGLLVRLLLIRRMEPVTA